MTGQLTIDLPEKVGGGYGEFWRSRHEYLVVKGSRQSKKSTTAALKLIWLLMSYPDANALAVRRFFVTHRDSTYAQLKWAIRHLGVSHLWESKLSPLELVYKPTGQKILFRGLDDADSITSITVDHGHLCFVWIEEAYQIQSESDFDRLDMSIRGELPSGLFRQFIITFNPWTSNHWLKPRFFDEGTADPNTTLALTTTYQCNEFISDQDRARFEYLRKHKPNRYRVEGLGDWGITEGAIYDNWVVRDFDWREMARKTNNGRPWYRARFGLDFGFSVDPTALVALLCDTRNDDVYVFDELYLYGATIADIAEAITARQYHTAKIVADNSEPRTIAALNDAGIRRCVKSVKGPGSVATGIRELSQRNLIIHPSCANFETEIAGYRWAQDANGRLMSKPDPDCADHLMDATRYALEGVRPSFAF